MEALNAKLLEKALKDLIYHPVEKPVSSARNNDPFNIKPVQAEFGF